MKEQMNEEKGHLHKETMARFERLFPGPIERVWDSITQSEQLIWIGGGTIEPRAGGAVNLAQGHILGTVTQWKPPRRLTYTWNVFAPGEVESPYPESYLTFELEPKDGEVLLTLTHRPVLAEFEGRTLMGWHTLLEMLGGQLRGQALEPREVLMERNRVRYGVEKWKP